ncbi:hypothetical protein HanRHA438_Chr08g0345501 [Helianthus annuus]|uniref:Uncharacterized protein n=1 Tax=Helianthus annuus TaxID=4232 RepID=A0A9K3NCP4_HELAN|nr:hypothetical protein HanXRQr2_Chr08g0334171 [Helianthus annuus]KAJ0897416.1 hypothetical protein HanRHA438_Chr08g0345501 [Helianthus annuus]
MWECFFAKLFWWTHFIWLKLPMPSQVFSVQEVFGWLCISTGIFGRKLSRRSCKLQRGRFGMRRMRKRLMLEILISTGQSVSGRTSFILFMLVK